MHDEIPPRHSQFRRWAAEQSASRVEYEAFRSLAEARERPDALAILDTAAGKTLAVFPASLDSPPARPECPNRFGVPLLSEAVRSGRLELVQLLMAHGCDPSRTDPDGLLPVDLADREGHALIDEFLRAKADELLRRAP